MSIVDTGGASDSDYSTLSSWENAIGTNLTAPDTFVFSGTVTGTAPSDGAQVTLYRSGASTGVGATVVHTAKAGSQIMLKGVGNTSPAYYQASDEWRIDASNLFLLSGTAPDQPQVTAKCRATTGTADTTAVTINGWDTDSTHYIKIWTDPSENYRHQGKWDTGKYRMELVALYGIQNYESFVRVDGIQIKNSYTTGNTARVIFNRALSGSIDTKISNSIIVGNYSGGATSGRGLEFWGAGSAWNNIIYNVNGLGIVGDGQVGPVYVYNNTIYNSGCGIYRVSGTLIAKNNLSYNNTDNYYGTFVAGSANNLSGPSSDSDIASTTAPQNGVTVTFADVYNNDFHLDSSDTGAKNNGTILYDSGDDSNLNFTTDIDNEARKDVAGSWDIGADENVAKIYRSVGAGATSPLAWGGTADSSYGNMTISGLIATFWRPLPDNVGVGDALQYDQDNTGGIDKIVFITKRIDSTHYSVRKSDGTAPDATTSLPNSGWGIYRSYISLSNAEAGTENTGINDTVENFDTWSGGKDLTTNNEQWNIACYGNGTTADTTAVSIASWTTTADNYIRIFTPTRTDEVGTSQRHQGKWDTSKYYLQVTDNTAFSIGISPGNGFTRIDGIQLMSASPTADGKAVIYLTGNIDDSNFVYVSNSILKGGNSNSYYQRGISLNTSKSNLKVWNNIIYDIYPLNGNSGGIVIDQCANVYAYNNTIYGTYFGIYRNSGTVLVKNNVVQSSTTGYSGTFDSTSTNNLSDHADAPGLNPQNTKTVSFVDATNKDFHLAPGDSVARNIGADLSNDLYLPIQTDIDSSGSTDGKSCDSVYQDACLTRPRATSWDIGADELITKIYRSVGVGTTAAIISGTSASISLTISGNTGTFATFPTSADFGVGDVIRYDSDNNGSLDSTAFISAIDSTAKTATLQNSTGGTAPQMVVGDFDWKLYRAYTSLSGWDGGTENTGIGVTYDSGNRDIASNSEQWHVALYTPSGSTTPDTTGITINGWTTAQQNYIKIYTPTASTEVTASQRHQGKWDEQKYRMETSDNGGIAIYDEFVRIDGLQIKITVTNTSDRHAIFNAVNNASSMMEVSNCILKGNITSDDTGSAGVSAQSAPSHDYKIWNNIIYGFTVASSQSCGIALAGAGGSDMYVYNNTLIGNDTGIFAHSGTTRLIKNNLSYDNKTDYSGTFNSASSYNISKDATSPNAEYQSKTVSFVDPTNYDFHLSSSDAAAKNAGVDLSQDLYLPVSSDLDSQTRISNFQLPISNQIPSPNSQYDIGADQSANAIYRSLAPSATGSIASGTNPANSMIIAGTSVTFGTAPGDTIGVGDAIQYDSDNNGSIDSVAFISGRTSGTVYTIQDRTGGTPTSTSATDYDWSIFRSYTSLQNATGSSTGGTENTGLADAVEHFDIDWSASHGKNIYTANQQWNVAAYANSTTADSTATIISGWTTYPTNYLKVYTPYATTEVGTSQRYQGKWDTSKYYRTIAAGSTSISDYTSFFRVEGIQIQITSTIDSYTNGIYLYNTPGSESEFQISNNIIKGVLSDSADHIYGIRTSTIDTNRTKILKIWNNLVYDFVNGSSSSIEALQIYSTGYSVYLYNNTVYNSYYGFRRYGGTVYAKNNIAQNCTDGYYGTFDGSSDYNISNIAGDTTGISASYRNGLATTVTFADSANKDFHLASTDTSARNSGADLSADAYLPITTDIDGHTRPIGTNVVDIGADEGATAIYYSVGQSTSTDFKVASNVSVSGYTATFDTAQTGNIGVGDIVTYTGGSCTISGKTSTLIWSCQNVTGGTAPQVSGVAVTSIKRAFASLNSSIGGSTAPEFLNTTDLKANNYQLNIPCYMDSGTQPDTTAVTIQGYTTAVPNYIKVYTPSNTTTEANQSQRHQGKWDEGKYKLEVTANYSHVIDIGALNVKVDGLQISTTNSGGNAKGINANTGSTVEITNNIIRGILSGTAASAAGIGDGSGSTASRIWNNTIYGFVNGANSAYGIYEYAGWTYGHYVYNNTIYNCYIGIQRDGGIVVAKNNIVQNSTTGYSGTFDSTSTNNLSDHADAPGTNPQNSKTVTFQDSTNKDFHLGIGDTAARNYGINIGTGSTEPYLVVTSDIDGNNRNTDSRGYDIGADEAATAIYYSVGQSSSDLKTGSPTLSIDASGNGTLDVAQTGNMGVGDYIEYGTSPYAKAYITGKTSSTVWTVQSATGTSLGVATTEPVNSIKHSYTSLNGAIAGASGSTMMNTTDLYTNNLQLSVPCYMDSGTADTSTVTISGYTTYSTNYIKVYTPTNTTTEANNSQRHQGKWDEGKYRLEVAGTAIIASSDYIKLDGLQLQVTSVDTDYRDAIWAGDVNHHLYISNNIIKGVLSGTSSSCYGITLNWASNSKEKKALIWNNIFYGWKNGSYNNAALIINSTWSSVIAYNNTAYNNYLAYSSYDTNDIFKNNIAQNNTTDYSGTFSASSANNISSDATSPNPGSTDCGGHSCRSQTVNFVDSANYDFHLAENDSSARNTGADLSTDAQLSVSTDIDGNSRPSLGTFDIGADEGSTYIYYSVGQNTSDHKTLGVGGSAPTITLSGYNATLNVAQTAPNMGVGDLITYTGGSCYITSKTSDDKMHWNCQNATGGTAPQVSGVSVTSIAHAFDSLGGNTDLGALSANSGQGAKNSSHLNTSDLYSGNYILNIPCYYDNAADTSPVTVNNWTTAANNYIKVYTPTNISTEANSSQRHNGKWDTGKYYMNNTNAGLYIYDNYFWIDGIQLKVLGNDSGWPVMIEINSLSPYDNKIKISNNILQADYSGMVTYGGNAVSTSWGNQNVLNIWNNIIYDSVKSTHFGGLYITGGKNYVYNNTFANLNGGIYVGAGSAIVKNNIVQNADDGYSGGFASGSDYNISNVSGDTTGGAHDKDNTTVTFISSTDKNYHLSLNDSGAKNQGIKLASYSDDSNLNFTTDIDGNSRTGDWSIGADDGPFVEAQQSKNIDTNESLNSGLVGYWSFDGDDMKGIGIGGTALDKSGNGNDGILSGTAPGPTATIGKRGQGMIFDGTDDYVNCGSGASLDDLHTTGGLTISAWIKPETAGEGELGRILDKDSNFSGYWHLDVYGNNSKALQFLKDGSTDLLARSSNGVISFNKWQYVAVSWDGSTTAANAHIYVNGVETGYAVQTDGVGFLSDSSLATRIAANGAATAGFAFDGSLDEVRIYNRALSADEIGRLYRMGQVTIDKDLGNAVIKK
ncbi:MAG TPA: LamG domain-containing protein [Candidatus Moranbacteria bacterium]|nr:LamG domain-containing protein [Candidatus Moranbacteria bacterium]